MNSKIIAQNKPRILITSFNAFLDIKDNTSNELCKKLEKIKFDAIIKHVCLDASFKNSEKMLRKSILDFQPSHIISFGVLNFKRSIRIKSIARNFNSSLLLADNSRERRFSKISKTGSWIIKPEFSPAILQETLSQNNIKSRTGELPELYVCNHTFYSGLQFIKEQNLDTRMSFIHNPNSIFTTEKMSIIQKIIQIFKYPEKKLIKAGKIIIDTIINEVNQTGSNSIKRNLESLSPLAR